MSVESEGQLKLGSRSAKESSVLAGALSADQMVTNEEPKKSKNHFNLKETLEAIQVELAALRVKVETRSKVEPVSSNKQNAKRSRKYLCTACEQAKADRCEHCFKCRSEEQLARGCKSRNPANGSQLRPRDRK